MIGSSRTLKEVKLGFLGKMRLWKLLGRNWIATRIHGWNWRSNMARTKESCTMKNVTVSWCELNFFILILIYVYIFSSFCYWYFYSFSWCAMFLIASCQNPDMHGSQTWVWKLGWVEGSIPHITPVSFWLVCEVSHNSGTCEEMWYVNPVGGEREPRIWWEGETSTQGEKAC